MSETLDLWHKFVASPDPALLDRILADEVTFHSPFVWKPKEGKAITAHILMTVTGVFEGFHYVRQIVTETDWCLEFEAKVSGLTLRGVDLIKLGNDGRIVDFEVMIRPANSLQALGLEMGKRLGADRP